MAKLLTLFTNLVEAVLLLLLVAADAVAATTSAMLLLLLLLVLAVLTANALADVEDFVEGITSRPS